MNGPTRQRRGIGRRWIAALATIVLVHGAVLQMKEAQANPVFLPLIVGVLFSGVMGVGTAIEMWDGAPTAAAAIAAPALSVTIANPADNGAAGGAVRVPTTSSAASAAAVPAPSAPAVGDPPSSKFCGQWYNGTGGLLGKVCQADSTNIAENSCVGGSIVGGRCVVGSVVYDGFTNGPETTCGSGYVISGSDCLLSNARAAVADGKQDLTRTGEAYSTDPDDLKGAVNAVLSASYVSNDTVSVSGMSVGGQPRMVSTTAKSGGGSEVVQITQKEDGAGNTYLEKRSYSIDPSGIITGASSSSTPGALQMNGPGTGYTVSGGSGTYTPAAPGSGTGVAGSGTGATDYARQGEADAAANKVVGALTGAAVAAPDAATVGQVKTAMEGLCTGDACSESSVLNPGSSWMPRLFPTPITCHALSFRAVWGTLDASTELDLCPYLEIVSGILSWIVSVLAIAHIWRRFTTMYQGG